MLSLHNRTWQFHALVFRSKGQRSRSQTAKTYWRQLSGQRESALRRVTSLSSFALHFKMTCSASKSVSVFEHDGVEPVVKRLYML